MCTPKQLEASRGNGALSHGPVTPAGKARSVANSLAHGLTAKTIVLTSEGQPRFQALLDSFIAQFAPANESEFCCVEELALARCCLRRAAGYETAQPSTLKITVASTRPPVAPLPGARSTKPPPASTPLALRVRPPPRLSPRWRISSL